jgi:hypothetical protein
MVSAAVVDNHKETIIANVDQNIWLPNLSICISMLTHVCSSFAGHEQTTFGLSVFHTNEIWESGAP